MCNTCGCHGKQLEKSILNIAGMSCGHCKSAVEKAVRGLPGVLAAEVNLDAKTLSVEYNSSETVLADITAAIVDVGFAVV